MKKSTVVVGVSVLSLVGVGVYLYLKNKKSVVASSVPTTSPSSTSTATSPSSTTQTMQSAFDESQTDNYKKSKLLSKDIEALRTQVNSLNSQRSTASNFRPNNSMFGVGLSPEMLLNQQGGSLSNSISIKTKQAKVLGYKILPYGDIEKI